MIDVTELQRDRTERWFVHQGLPHLIDQYSVREDVLTRMFPFLSLVVFLEVFLVFGDRWSGFGQAVAFIGGVSLMIGVFTLVNRLRNRRLFALPDRVGTPEVILFLALPAIPTGIGTQDALGENILFIVGFNIIVLVLGSALTAWGILPMLRWSFGQVWRQINDIANLAMKSLPLLLLFSAFIFLNAEMWQVAHDFTYPLFGAVLVVVVGIGSAFVVISVRRTTIDLARFHQWSEVRPYCGLTPVVDLIPSDDDPPPNTPPLGRRSEWNVTVLLFVSQAIQILLVALVITAFYMLFGIFTVREDTLLQWTEAVSVPDPGGNPNWGWSFLLFGSEIIFTRQLVFVSGFIGMMSGLQFAVQVVTDKAYREEFTEGMTAEIREAMAVRAVYHSVIVPSA